MPERWDIVLIDDEEDIREVTAIALSDAGYAVRTAGDGETGLRLCREAPPQIVITDIRMPGMDGLQVLEQIKRRHPETEVIVATAFGEIDLAVRALQLDASDFITKPIGEEALRMALQRARERFTSRQRLKEYLQLLEAEKAQTSQQLLASLAFQRSLIEHSMDGILGADGRMRIVVINRSMVELTGVSREEALHRMPFAEIFAPGEFERFLEAFRSDRYGGRNRLFLYEALLRHVTEGDVPVQISASAVAVEGGEGLVGFFRDLRKVRRLERELADQARILHQDKMMSLGRLAASVVHEINNPLSGVRNYLQLMQRMLQQKPLGGEQLEKFKRYLEIAEGEIGRCAQIVAGLLGFSRRSEPKLQAVDLADVVRRCLLLSRHKLELSGIRVQSVLPTVLPPVRGDPNQLQQCLINLIFNAVDAMPGGGELELEVQADPGGRTVRVRVADTGPGIPPEHLPRLFEPFFSTKKEGCGLGLGLATAWGIIERHGGKIEVENRSAGGACFTIVLPVVSP
ncbi:MAG: response regulator [Desulfobacterales bacterium]